MKKFLLIILASCAAIVGCQKVSLSLPAVINVKVGETAPVKIAVHNDFKDEVKTNVDSLWVRFASGDEGCISSPTYFSVKGEEKGSCVLTYKYKPLDISASTTVVVTE